MVTPNAAERSGETERDSGRFVKRNVARDLEHDHMSPTLTGQLEESYSSITNLGGVFRNGYGVLLERSIGSINAAGKETTPSGAMRLEVETDDKSKDSRHLVSDCKVIHFRPHFFDDTSAVATAKPRVLRDEV